MESLISTGPDLNMIACKQTFTMHVCNRDYESDIFIKQQKAVGLYRHLRAKTDKLVGFWHHTKTPSVPQIQRRIFVFTEGYFI